ncbi:MAG: mechanosensitive ion channel [Candidatus Gracilibacteria bacterium]|nr:mechanosensitive ion channel [Candidatus Gracilibacteria bacterium]
MPIINYIKDKLLIFTFYFTIILLLLVIGISRYHELSFLKDFIPIYSELIKILNYQLFSGLGLKINLLSIFIFVFTVYLGISIGKYYQKIIYSLKKRNKNISNGTVTILANIGYYLIIILVVLSSLKVIGIDLSNITMIVSALSVGIGFGLQTIVSNFISGMILMFEQSIKTGDYIELSDGLKGVVISINMRSTTIRTTNNVNIIVPNQSFVQNNIINWSLGDNRIRLQIPFGVSYGTKYEKVEEVILGALIVSDLDFIRTDSLFPTIVMIEMGPSSVNYLLNVWIDSDDLTTPTSTKGQFIKLVYKTLTENNFTIPFPQTDLHIKESIPLEIRLISDK